MSIGFERLSHNEKAIREYQTQLANWHSHDEKLVLLKEEVILAIKTYVTENSLARAPSEKQSLRDNYLKKLHMYILYADRLNTEPLIATITDIVTRMRTAQWIQHNTKTRLLQAKAIALAERLPGRYGALINEINNLDKALNQTLFSYIPSISSYLSGVVSTPSLPSLSQKQQTEANLLLNKRLEKEASAQAELSHLPLRLADLHKASTLMRTEVNLFNEQIESMKAHIIHLENLLLQSNSTEQQLQTEITDLNTRLANSDSIEKQLRAEITSLQEQLEKSSEDSPEELIRDTPSLKDDKTPVTSLSSRVKDFFSSNKR